MPVVNIREGVRYGFFLLGYFLIIFLIGGIIVEIGIELYLLDSQVLTGIGVIVIAIGGLIIYTGLLGVTYKIIADGVERGIRSAQRPAEERDSGQSTPAKLIESVTTRTDDRNDQQ